MSEKTFFTVELLHKALSDIMKKKENRHKMVALDCSKCDLRIELTDISNERDMLTLSYQKDSTNS